VLELTQSIAPAIVSINTLHNTNWTFHNIVREQGEELLETRRRTKLKVIVLTATILLSLAAICCSGSKAPAPAASNTNAAAAKPAAKPGEIKVGKPGDKAPDNAKMIPESARVAVPTDWVRFYDDDKGYEFYVPDGTKNDWQTIEGVDVFLGKLPEPANVGVIVIAFKDKSSSKADLVETAKKFLGEMGEKDIKVGTPQVISDDYDLLDVSSTSDKDGVTKAKLLVATDVTDNYVVLIGSPEAKFKANEKIIDEIWGSFGMYSGGASGSS
jgi:hypothetical protein